MSRRTEQIELELIIFRETELAVMVGRDDVDELEEIWLPKRALECAAGFDLVVGDCVPVLVPEALALKKGLI